MTTFVTVGANRVFARVEGEFTYQNWIDALKAGRTFVTNSPVLEFTVNGRDPGTTLQVGSKRSRVVQIHAAAESQIPYDRLEIVANGAVVAQATPSGPRNKAADSTSSIPSNRAAGWQRGSAKTWIYTVSAASTSARYTFRQALASATTTAHAGPKQYSPIPHPCTSSRMRSRSGAGKMLNTTSGIWIARSAG